MVYDNLFDMATTNRWDVNKVRLETLKFEQSLNLVKILEFSLSWKNPNRSVH